MSSVISVSNLSKLYRLGAIGSTTIRDDINRAWASLRRRPDPSIGAGKSYERKQGNIFWALRNVAFEIKQGDAMGIIGRNGAGKSTLLKILSRITAPTTGEVCVRGRVACLLEVGTGFHPELTGRENVFLNGAILGMTRREVRTKFDEIVDFSGVEEFIDTPVKRYSSGMYVRLAFAVAAHLDPEILIVDEVLAVGDASFQTKCIGKLHTASEKEGRTILFVSHNMQAIASLCSRAILLDAGQVEATGDARTVVEKYLTGAIRTTMLQREQLWTDITSAPGNDRIRIHRIGIVPEGSPRDSLIDMTTPFRIEVEYWNMVSMSSLILTLSLFALDGSPVFECSTTKEPNWHSKPFPKGLFRSTCHIPANFLNEGVYQLRVYFVDDQLLGLYNFVDNAMVAVTDSTPRNTQYFGRFIGHIHPDLSWQTALIDKNES